MLKKIAGKIFGFQQEMVAELESSITSQELTFTHAIGEWNVGKEEVEDVIEGLAATVNKKQSCNSPSTADGAL